MGTNLQYATETAENGGGQAGTMLLSAVVIVLPIAALLQLNVCFGTQECRSSLALCSSLVTERCTVIGPHSAMLRKKVVCSKSPDSFPT